MIAEIAELTVPALAATDELTALGIAAQRFVVLIKSGRGGTGSGVVWRPDGVIVTNHHVVAGHSEVEVVWSDDRTMTGTVVASDPTLDLAVVKVAADGLDAAPRAASARLRVGELVIAAGNPWGERGVVTLGIVSGLGEVAVPWRRQSAEYVRSDVLIAPGNSGGPLLNMAGAVVGINAMIFGNDLSVAIPSDVATQFVQLTEQQPRLGVGVQRIGLPPRLADVAGQASAVQILELTPGGAAERGGLQVGDVILAIGAQALTDSDLLRVALAALPFAQPVAVQIIRAEQRQTLTLALDALIDRVV